METIAILFMLILANLIYIALSCYYKTKKEDLVKMHPIIFEGLISSFLFYRFYNKCWGMMPQHFLCNKKLSIISSSFKMKSPQ